MLTVAGKICHVGNNLLTETIYVDANTERNEIICSFFNLTTKVQYIINNRDKLKVLEDGTFLCTYSLLDTIISKLSNGDISISLTDKFSLTIQKDDFLTNINVLDPSLFVELTFPDVQENSFELNTNIFYDIKNKLLQCCISKESNKTSFYNENILSQVCINSVNNERKLNIYTTDSFRVALLTLNNFENNNINFTVNQEFINFMISTFNENEIIKFFEKNNNIYFQTPKFKFIYRKTDTVFPSVLSVMNTNDAIASAIVNAKTLYNAIDRGYFVVAGEKIPVSTFTRDQNRLIMNFKSLDVGSVQETIDLQNSEGRDITVHLNSKLLLPMIKAFGDSDIKLYWLEVKNQYRLFFEDLSNPNFKQLLLLLRE